jgi:indole-3-glycerol phosphate synthase
MTRGTYLDEIVRDVQARLDAEGAIARADDGAHALLPVRSLAGSIAMRRTHGELAVIAEVKRRSPSVGAIDLDVDPAARAGEYAAGGAAGISVLTEPDHFGGTLDDLVLARDAAGDVPVLRKDFILDERQIHAARVAGADAVLLIAALHGEQALAELIAEAEVLGLEALVEVHDEQELERTLAAGAQLIGINSRDLTTFAVDLAVVERLAPQIHAGRLVVAESGIRSVADAEFVRAAGVDAVLVGEALMRAPDRVELLRAFAAVGAGAPR